MRLVSVALALLLGACGSPVHDPAPTVALAEVVRGGMSVARAGTTEQVAAPTRVEDGATVSTDDAGRGAVTLDAGAWILFDRDTAGVASLAALRLERGRIWVDASAADETRIETAHGTFTAEGAAFAVALDGDVTRVYCGSGEVTYHTERGEGRIGQGETVTASASSDPGVSPEALWDDWTGGLADPARGRLRTTERVGVLAGRTLYEIGIARAPLPVRGHEVNVTIRDDLAVTEIIQTFFNARSESLEGEWAMRLPRGAIVQDFAVDRGDGFVDSSINTVNVSSGYQIAWAPRSVEGAKLTWDGPERLRARIHPIAPGATVRVRVTYTEWLDRRAHRRTYVYPMRAIGEPPLLGEFVLTVDTSEANAGDLRAGMGAREELGRVVLRQSDFRPRADFYLDLYDPPSERESADRAAAYRVGGLADREQPDGELDYVLIDVPTASLAPAGEEAALDLVLLLDVSGATDPEDLEIARAVIESVSRQLAPTDRVAIRLADVRAHVPEGAPEGLSAASPETREQLLEALSTVDLGGATDLGESLRQAAALVASSPRGAVLYLGDGLPTTGGLDATSLRATLATLDSPPRFFGLAIGDGANVDLLRALFGDQAARVRDREAASRAVMQLLAEAARPVLRGVQVDVGSGIERVYPHAGITVGVGEHIRLVGRLADEIPRAVTVRGVRDGAPFESSIDVVEARLEDEGDVRRRWATARLAELLDADAGREAMVELGSRFGLVTPWTSRVVASSPGDVVPLVEGFEHDPLGVAWGMGGGGASVPITGLTSDELGWRRRMRPAEDYSSESIPETTWESRVSESAPAPLSAADARTLGDGGLGRASVLRALSTGARGPRQCYERRALVRPDLSGNVTVSVQVAGDGTVRDAQIASSSVYDGEVQECITTEVRGLRFAAHGGDTVTVQHTYYFAVPERELGTRRQCSEASRQDLEIRRALWRERLAQSGGVAGAIEVWRAARAACELGNWRARRTLLEMMLGSAGGIAQQVQLHRALAGDPAIASYLRRAILRRVRTPHDVQIVRDGLDLEVAVQWALFSRLWWQNESPEARLALVRRWLEVAPDELDLRLRLLSLLEQTNALPEARRVARELRAEPLADARVRAAVGEFWLRRDDQAEARRVFSEIVEHAPFDPWARRRLGDLYRAHAWPHEAYREYQTLSRLLPGEEAVLLLLARAAADAERTDEALRLEQRLSEATEPGMDEGVAAHARLWTMVRLARLELAASEDPALLAAIRRRWREAGVLRDPPDAFVALSWSHPEDRPQLSVHWPGIEDAQQFEPASLGGHDYGIWAVRIREREEGEHTFEVRRADRESLRETETELMIILRPGTTEQRIVRTPITLTRERRIVRYRLGSDDSVTEVPVVATVEG